MKPLDLFSSPRDVNVHAVHDHLLRLQKEMHACLQLFAEKESGSRGLSPDAVRSIRCRRAQGETYRALALDHGVTESTIGRIVNGTAHRHVR